MNHPERLLLLLTVVACLRPTGVAATESQAALSYCVHFIGHSGTDRPAQTMATGLAVAENGTCFVSSNGPGDHPAPCWYTEGKLAGRCAVPDVPGLRFTGPLAVSPTHLFAAVRVTGASTPDSQAPETIDGIWRFNRDGSHAPARSDPRSALCPVLRHDPRHSAPKSPAISGIWVHDHEVFVSDAENGRIRVFDARSLESSRYFKADRPSAVCVLQNQLHAIERRAVVSTFSLDGRRTGQILDEGDEFIPAALAPTPEGRLMVADAGSSQQIHLFNMSGVPTRVRTLGDPGGMRAPPAPGEVGARRLTNIIGVGADAAGGLYLAMNPPPGGCALRAFARDRLTLRWQSTTLAILGGADATPSSQGSDILTTSGRHALDLSKPPGLSWRWVGQPPPMAIHPDPHSSISLCEINSHGFRSLRSPDGRRLDLLRIVGHATAPVATWETDPAPPGTSALIWLDTNGNGLPDPPETSPSPLLRGRFPSTPIDASGGIWTIDGSTIHCWPCQRIDPSGIPIHSPQPDSFRPLPESSGPPDSLCFDPPSSSLFLSTQATSSQEASLYRFSPWPPPNPTPSPLWRLPLPATTAIAAAGDLLFTLIPATGSITVHRLSNGTPVGHLTPPASPTPTQPSLAPPTLHTIRLPDKSYLILTQDPTNPRTLAFHLTQFPTDPPQ